MRRLTVMAAIAAGIIVTGIPRAEVPAAFAGKSGKGLREVIRRECRLKSLTPQENLKLDFTFYDAFTGDSVRMERGRLPGNYISAWIVPPVWWGEDAKVYGDTVSQDLHNFLPIKTDVYQLMGDRPPGEVTDVTHSGGAWSVGRGEVYGESVDLYSPPVDARGRVARAYFYMSVMYPQEVMTGGGMMVMGWEDPKLSSYWRKLFLEWSRENPVDDYEIELERAMAGVQGGENPFVTVPGLEEYVWGEKAESVFEVAGEPVPLHSTYHYGKGERIELVIPDMPADAKWSVDGMEARMSSYTPEELGDGTHDLVFTSASTGETGRVSIKIVR